MDIDTNYSSLNLATIAPTPNAQGGQTWEALLLQEQQAVSQSDAAERGLVPTLLASPDEAVEIAARRSARRQKQAKTWIFDASTKGPAAA